MKTNRTSTKGSAARATKQAATVTTSNNAAPAAEPTTLAIICEGREVARIEYSAEEFGRLERARAALNCSLEEFFEAAIKEKLPALEASPGAVRPPKKQVRAHADGQSMVSLLFLDDDVNELAGLDYSAEEFQEIQTTAKNSGQTLSEFLISAINARLKRNLVLDEFENAIDQAQGFTALLEHQVLNPDDGEPGENIKNGIVHLGIETFARLCAAAELVEKPELAKAISR